MGLRAGAYGNAGSLQFINSTGSPVSSRIAFGADATNWKLAFAKNISGSYTDLMTLESFGNLGIGTITPQAKLDVYGSVNIHGGLNVNSTRPAISVGTLTNGEIRGYSTSASTSDDGFLRLSAGGGTQAVEKSFIDISGFSNVADMNRTIRFGTWGAERMRINQVGYLGIATNNPQYRVHIEGDAENSILIRSKASSAGSANNILFQRSSSTSATPNAYLLGGISFGGYDGTDWSEGWNGGSQILSRSSGTFSSVSRPSDLSFTTTPINAIGSIERMRITSDGDVGIGISSPTAPLQITKSSSAPAGYGTTAKTLLLFSTLNATSNGQSLVALDVSPIFNTGAYTSVGTYAARFAGDVQITNGSGNQLTIPNGSSASPGIRVASGEFGMYYNGRLGLSFAGVSRLDFDSDDMAARVDAFIIDNTTGDAVLNVRTQGTISAATNTFFGRYGNENRAFIRTDITSGAPNWTGEFSFHTDGKAEKAAGSPNWIVPSDIRVKKDIRPFTDGLDKLLKLNPVYFRYISEDTKERVGFVAQEVEEVVDYMVSINEGREIKDLRTVDEAPLTKILVNSIKEQQNIINELIKRIEKLESKS